MTKNHASSIHVLSTIVHISEVYNSNEKITKVISLLLLLFIPVQFYEKKKKLKSILIYLI